MPEKRKAIMNDWMMELDRQLSGLKADGVLTSKMIWREADYIKSGISRPSVQRWISKAAKVGKLSLVSRGIYLNNQALPRPDYAEAAQFIRPGSIVSMHKVLTDIGALNNPYPVITAILPLGINSSPRLGIVSAGDRRYRYFGMPVGILNAGEEDDRLDGRSRYPRTTPERALLDWMYFARSPKSKMVSPPMDIDLDWLDKRRFRRLLKAMQRKTAGIEQYWEDWYDRWQQHSQDGV